jgi:hypothetical protein
MRCTAPTLNVKTAAQANPIAVVPIVGWIADLNKGSTSPLTVCPVADISPGRVDREDEGEAAGLAGIAPLEGDSEWRALPSP